MKILCVGSNGMLGHMAMKYFHDHDITGTTRQDFDITDVNAVARFFSSHGEGFDYVINCAGMLVSDSRDNIGAAVLVNSWFPNFLQITYKNSKTRVIHVSTDCVFDGIRGNYREQDIPTETNAYGRSKAMGEIINHKDITLRTSIIGPEISDHRSGLLDWVVNRSSREIQGWEDSWWNGVTTLQLCRVIEQVMGRTDTNGLYHVASAPINKYELVRTIAEVYDLDKEITKTKGPKPINKILINTRHEIEFSIPPHRNQLLQLKRFCHDV